MRACRLTPAISIAGSNCSARRRRSVCGRAAPLFIDRANRIAQSLELGIAGARGHMLRTDERLPALPSRQRKGRPMNTTLDRMALGEIAVLLPGASAIFRRYGMDFCCGGDVLLADAVKEPGVALEQIVAELRALDQSAPRAYPEEPGALIDHILERYHETHRRELPELIRLAEKVERVHASHPDVPAGIAEALRTAAYELETHMMKEEAVLFPMMRLGHASGHRSSHSTHAHRAR
jgi:iron-sulfur cluster repair protein YtfE (RIC family)